MTFAELMKAAETLNRQRYGSHAVAEPYAMVEIACRELEGLAKRVDGLEGTATTTASDASAVIDRYEAEIERLKAERIAAIDEARAELERAREERAKAQSLWGDIAAAVADGRRDCAEKLARTRENLDAALDALERCTHDRDVAEAERRRLRLRMLQAAAELVSGHDAGRSNALDVAARLREDAKERP
jgi:predicted  nucleic acid-binding Zn-ribbon protein